MGCVCAGVEAGLIPPGSVEVIPDVNLLDVSRFPTLGIFTFSDLMPAAVLGSMAMAMAQGSVRVAVSSCGKSKGKWHLHEMHRDFAPPSSFFHGGGGRCSRRHVAFAVHHGSSGNGSPSPCDAGALQLAVEARASRPAGLAMRASNKISAAWQRAVRGQPDHDTLTAAHKARSSAAPGRRLGRKQPRIAEEKALAKALAAVRAAQKSAAEEAMCAAVQAAACEAEADVVCVHNVHHGLWMGAGSSLSPSFVASLKQQGFVMVVNAMNNRLRLPPGVDELRVDVDDDPFASIEHYFGVLAERIQAALLRGLVLVVCRSGRSRSATLVAAFGMMRAGLSLDESMAAVKSARPIANPNYGFMAKLVTLSQDLQNLHRAEAARPNSGRKSKKKQRTPNSGRKGQKKKQRKRKSPKKLPNFSDCDVINLVSPSGAVTPRTPPPRTPPSTPSGSDEEEEASGASTPCTPPRAAPAWEIHRSISEVQETALHEGVGPSRAKRPGSRDAEEQPRQRCARNAAAAEEAPRDADDLAPIALFATTLQQAEMEKRPQQDSDSNEATVAEVHTVHMAQLQVAEDACAEAARLAAEAELEEDIPLEDISLDFGGESVDMVWLESLFGSFDHPANPNEPEAYEHDPETFNTSP